MPRMDEQRAAYIPIIAPEALTAFPDGKLPAGEVGVMPLVRGIDKDVREVKENLWAFKKETNSAIAELRQDVSTLKGEVSALKTDVSVLKADVSLLKGDVRSLGVRMDGFDKRLDDLHQSQNRWFTLLGILVAAVPIAVALVQGFMTR